MKVNFKDCEFGCFEPHFEIEYGGKQYRAIEVEYELDNGHRHASVISESDLIDAMRKRTGEYEFDFDGGEESRIDGMVSYYSDAEEGVYYILETITGEEIK